MIRPADKLLSKEGERHLFVEFNNIAIPFIS
jgi:hypothetical protein